MADRRARLSLLLFWPLLGASACSTLDVHPIKRGFIDDAGALDRGEPADRSSGDASALSGSILWVRAIGGSGSDSPGSIAIGADESLLLTGSFEESFSYDHASLTSAGASDIFVLKLENDASLRWARRYGGAGADRGHHIAAMEEGAAIATGGFSGQVDFGPTQLRASDGDGFVLALEADGRERFAHGFGAAFGDVGHEVAPSLAGGSVVVGAVGLGSDIWVEHLAADGASTWSSTYASTGGTLTDDRADALAIDPSGLIFVSGFFQISANFAGTELLSAGYADVFISAVDELGALQWVRAYGGASGFDMGRSLALAESGRLYLAGEFQSSAQFGAIQLSGGGSYSAFVTEISPSNGDVIWAKGYDATGYAGANALAVGSDGRLFVAGRYTESIDLGGISLDSVGDNDIFVACLDPDGETLWAQSVGGVNHEGEPELALGADERLYLIGSFEGEANFGEEVLRSMGPGDTFLMAIVP